MVSSLGVEDRPFGEKIDLCDESRRQIELKMPDIQRVCPNGGIAYAWVDRKGKGNMVVFTDDAIGKRYIKGLSDDERVTLYTERIPVIGEKVGMLY